jgi:uncharacterized protein
LSGLYVVRNGRLHGVEGGDRAHPRVQLVHDKLRASVSSSAYPCVIGASVIRADNYAFASYDEFGTAASAGRLARDLEWFVEHFPVPDDPSDTFSTFISVYERPSVRDDAAFEALLWRHLTLVHEADRGRWAWDPAVSSDPEDPKFSFSVAGHAFFVVGMHPAGSRLARTAPAPTLVFNRHDQFDVLRRRGKMDRVKSVIRTRDRRLQGGPNPVLADFGEDSEARQYSGRMVDADWRCPFRPRPRDSVVAVEGRVR